jgi:catechol 2,3-dioxygenase-like lactoylglutathione lyase family enzyme
MIGYVTLGSNDLPRAAAFYDAVLGLIGCKRVMNGATFISWGQKRGSPMLGVIKPYDGNPPTVGNGVMVALSVDSQELVQQIYAKVIELGGTDEGPPGLRGGSFYAAYFRDLDGNKLNAYTIVKP